MYRSYTKPHEWRCQWRIGRMSNGVVAVCCHSIFLVDWGIPWTLSLKTFCLLTDNRKMDRLNVGSAEMFPRFLSAVPRKFRNKRCVKSLLCIEYVFRYIEYSILAFGWRDWGKSWKTSALTAEFRAVNLPPMSIALALLKLGQSGLKIFLHPQ
jgi:hypothetical protein